MDARALALGAHTSCWHTYVTVLQQSLRILTLTLTLTLPIPHFLASPSGSPPSPQIDFATMAVAADADSACISEDDFNAYKVANSIDDMDWMDVPADFTSDNCIDRNEFDQMENGGHGTKQHAAVAFTHDKRFAPNSSISTASHCVC